jgi:hypothetical protein
MTILEWMPFSVLVPLIAAPLCALLPGRVMPWSLALLAVAASAVISALVLPEAIDQPLRYAFGNWPPPFGIEYYVDAVNAFLALLISAMAARYSIPAPTASELPDLARAYAVGMETAAAAAPDQAMVQFLAADAQMNLGPWDYWADPPHGTTFKPHASKASVFLQRALALEPKHAGGSCRATSG